MRNYKHLSMYVWDILRKIGGSNEKKMGKRMNRCLKYIVIEIISFFYGDPVAG